MKKLCKYLLLLIPFMFMFSSCVNLIEENVNTQISYTVGEEAARSISKSLEGSRVIDNSTELKVTSVLLNKDNKQVTSASVNTTLGNLASVKLHLSKIPFGNDYTLKMGVLYKDCLIYEGESKGISITSGNPNVSAQPLALREVKSSITYILNGGKLPPDYKPVKTYFVTDNIPLESPTLDSSTFLGWYATPDCSGENITKLGQDNFLGDVTLYAKWKSNKCTISYDTGNTCLIESKTVFEGTRLTEVDLPTPNNIPKLNKDGYKFDGWFISNEPANVGYKVTTDIILTASWTENTYTITYDLNNGTFSSSESVINSYSVTSSEIKLPTPTRENYTFDGWFTDNNLATGKAESIPTGSSGDKVFYAKWTENGKTADVTFDGPIGNEVESSGTNVTLNCSTPNARIYYTTDNTTPDTTLVPVSSGEVITIKSKTTLKALAIADGMKQSNTTTAEYVLKKYTVNFQTEYGTVPSQNLEEGSKVTEPSGLTRTGYTLSGWIKTKGATLENDVLWDFSNDTVPANDITLIAKWTPNNLSIDYKKSTGELVSTINYSYNEQFVIPSFNLETEGNILTWSTELNPSETSSKYRVGQLVNINDILTAASATDTVTLYANLTPIKYSIQYDFNGGTTTSTDSSVTTTQLEITYSDTETITLLDYGKHYTKNGMKPLNEWKTDDGVLLEAGKPVNNNLSKENGAVINLTAQWVDLIKLENPTFMPGENEVTISWTNPNSKLLRTVEIKYRSNTDPELTETVNVKPGKDSSVLLSNIKEGQEYTVTLTPIDANGVREIPSELTNVYSMKPIVYSDAPLSVSNPQNLPQTYNFGLYPQTIKEDSVRLSKNTKKILNWECYCGSDGYYYVEGTPENGCKDKTFSNGKAMEYGKKYYFKLEPITWKYTGYCTKDYGAMYYTEKLIYNTKWGDSSHNLYQNSLVNEKLNSEFSHNGFTTEMLSYIHLDKTLTSILSQPEHFWLMDFNDYSDTGSSHYFQNNTERDAPSTDYAFLQDTYNDGTTVNDVVQGTRDNEPAFNKVGYVNTDGSVPASKDGAVEGVYPYRVATFFKLQTQTFNIPKASVSKENQVMEFKVRNMIGGGEPTVTASNGLQANFISNTSTLSFRIPSTAGDYYIDIDYQEMKYHGTLTVTDYSSMNLEIGDVFMNDGTVVKANSVTAETKTNAVGVFYGKYNQYGAPLGVGLKQSNSKLKWVADPSKVFNDTYAYAENNNKDIECINVKFTPETDYDGSDNWDVVCESDPTGSQDPATNYPAFNYVLNYATTCGFTGEYANGWYGPSGPELVDIYLAVKDSTNTLNTVLSTLGASFNNYDMDPSFYFTSSQGHCGDVEHRGKPGAVNINFWNGMYYTGPLDLYRAIVRPIRVF